MKPVFCLFLSLFFCYIHLYSYSKDPTHLGIEKIVSRLDSLEIVFQKGKLLRKKYERALQDIIPTLTQQKKFALLKKAYFLLSQYYLSKQNSSSYREATEKYSRYDILEKTRIELEATTMEKQERERELEKQKQKLKHSEEEREKIERENSKISKRERYLRRKQNQLNEEFGNLANASIELDLSNQNLLAKIEVLKNSKDSILQEIDRTMVKNRRTMQNYIEENYAVREKSTLYSLFIIILFLLSVSSFLWQRLHLQQGKTMRLELEQQLTHANLEATRKYHTEHFSKNRLSSIEVYLLQQNPEKALTYLQAYKELSVAYLLASDNWISLEQELDFVQKYLNLEHLRLGDWFKYELDIAPDIDPSAMIPSLVLEPYIENAILHGLSPQGEGTLKISIGSRGGVIEIDIEDDGIGRAQSKNDSHAPDRTGKGMIMTERRLELLNDCLGFHEVDMVPVVADLPKGTRVSLQFPILFESDIEEWQI